MITDTRIFAGEQSSKLLNQLAFEITHTLKTCDADAVHDLRVAVRRFSQVLRVFRPCFLGKEMRKVRRQSKRIMDAAGQVRNCDIASKLLSKSGLEDQANFCLRVKNRRAECERELRGLLKSWIESKSSSKWRANLRSAVANTEEILAAVPVEATAQGELPRMARDFFKSGKRAAGTGASTEQLHRFRISAKKFRYTLELLAQLYDPRLVGLQELIQGTQRLLGEINDLATIQQMVAGHKGADGIDGWLRKRKQKKIEQFRQYWVEQFGDPETAANWMAYLATPAPRTLGKPVDSARAPSRSKRAHAAVA